MKPCQCLIMTGDIEDEMPVAAPCGEQVADKKNFRPGHDAKLKSTLIKAFRNGGSLVIRDGGSRTESSAREVAKRYGWERFLTPAKPKPAKATKADTKTDPTVEMNAAAEPVGASQPAQVQIRGGAWKDGFVTKIVPGDNASDPQMVTVTYTNSKRKQVEVTLPSDSDKLKLG